MEALIYSRSRFANLDEIYDVYHRRAERLMILKSTILLFLAGSVPITVLLQIFTRVRSVLHLCFPLLPP